MAEAKAATEALYEAAKAHHRAQRLAEAERLYRDVLERDPSHHDCLHRLGVLAYQCGDGASAEKLIHGAVRLCGEIAAYHNHLGVVQQALGQFERARLSLERAIALAPEMAEAHSNLGSLLLAQDKPEQAIMHLDRAYALAPETAEIAFNRGNVLRRLGKPATAAGAYREAIALQPGHAEAHVNLGLLLLAQGGFTEGGAEYDWRWRLRPPPSPLRQFDAPEWEGTSLPRGTVLLWAEQGLGDTIQFCRFMADAAQRCRHVVLEVPPNLVRLLAPMHAFGAVVAAGERLPPFDAHCPLLSLPWRLGVTQIAPRTPYLNAEPERVALWRERLPDGFRIGIAWQGNPSAKMDRHRSIPLTAFEPLQAVTGVTLVSLQKNHGTEQIGAFPGLKLLERLDDGRDAFIDTAAVMENLDLIVTSDTATAHLAGALGRPVWLALDAFPDWRWQLGTDDCPWYPTIQLFRQQTLGDWSPPFLGMAEMLRELAREKQ